MSRITINGITLDPAAQAQTLSHAALISPDSSDSDYILVQVRGPLKADERKQLLAAGAELLEYVPENTYVCRYLATDLAPIRKLPFVEWANVYLHAFKIAAKLRQPTATPAPTDLLRLHGTTVGSPAQQPQLVDVVLHRGVNIDDVRAQLVEAAGLDPDAVPTTQTGKLRVRVQPKRMLELSNLDVVRNIEPVFEAKLFNNLASKLIRADEVHAKLELQGEGEVVAVCDTGFDLGSTANVHPAFKGRVLKLYALGRATASDPDGHGTHVCGSVLGDGTSATDGPVRGTAPKAKLVMQSVLDKQGGLGGLPNDLHQLFQPPYTDDGARVHSNSWGGAAAGAYTTEAHELDDFVWNHRDLVVVFAAGNEGTDRNADGIIDTGSVGSPGTAKNCITVGACENARPNFAYVDGSTRITTYGQGWPSDYPADPIASDKLANDAEGLAAFSSRGPTKDGRIKPDVVAPGTGILSTKSRAPGATNGWGPSQDPAYFFEGGTSMATPLVSGCAAVLRQYFKKHAKPKPSAALIKAAMINTASNLTGQYHPTESGSIPNVSEGFGRVDLFAAVSETESQVFQTWDEGNALDTGEEQTFDVNLPAQASSFKATLVWTDPAGETLQNDLDLIVRTTKGTERHGNMRGNAKGFDRRNNVEQVAMTNVAAGKVTITVRAFRIALHPQNFALVVRTTD